MYYKQIITTFAVAFGASMAIATQHGDYVKSADGSEYRYRQLAEGVFSGVPVKEWDDSVHTASDQPWDLDEIKNNMFPHHNGTHHHGGRDLALESRNLADVCQEFSTCVKSGSLTLSTVINYWISTADFGAQQAGKDIISFLNSPFVCATLGIGIAGVVSAGLNSQWQNAAKCSTSANPSDMISAVLNSEIAKAPDTQNLSVQVTGPQGTWVVTVQANQPDLNFYPTC